MRIGFFGEVMREHRADGRGYGFGGDTLNTALYLHRLSTQHGLNIEVQYFTLLGQDVASEQLAATLDTEGLVLRAPRHPLKTLGQYWIDIDASGERSFRYQRDDSAVRQYFSPEQTSLQQTPLEQALADGSLDALYLSGISFAILTEPDRQRLYQAAADFVGRGGRLIYDNNFRPLLWQAEAAARWQQKLLPLCQLALLTDSDERLIWQLPDAAPAALVDAALHAGARTVLLKCGAAPCWVGTAALRLQVEAQQVRQLVDSSGAGDAFAAGFLARFLTAPDALVAADLVAADLVAADLVAAAQAGHQLAAAVVQQHGAIIPRELMPQISLQGA
ncbi:PfkB family carbohydrate kinase [Rheinheimera texasensis]|uniref:PfkB family carbohydrate kinase n=1 Tax=Rheinheimera texasensis TaxID=306205 RepID=UPI0004E16E2F|nr:PfkB family carbohydrate kinase [Rheinheimera texasensis]